MSKFAAGTAAMLYSATPAKSFLFSNKALNFRVGPKPNIILILADDLGYNDLSCYGSPDISTPTIDQLAADGVKFTHFYSNSASCTPTRTAFITGRYQQRVGGLECAIGVNGQGRYDDAQALEALGELGLPTYENSIGKIMKSVGYKTALIGKWHLGYDVKHFPTRHGFDYFWGINGALADYFHYCEYDDSNPGGFVDLLYENEQQLDTNNVSGYLTDLFTDRALEFIEQNKNSPFFLYLPYNAPHTPYQGPGDYTPQPVPQADYIAGGRPAFIAMVESLDQNINRILTDLENKNLADNTIVIFMSDNGGNAIGDNSPFRGRKGDLFEGGIRGPAIVRWPGKITPGTTSDQPCLTMDFTASIAAIGGASAPLDKPFDGADIIGAVKDNKTLDPRVLYWRWRRSTKNKKAIRDQNMKYYSDDLNGSVTEYLFDIIADPTESNNLYSASHPDAIRLKALVAAWETEVQAPRP